MAYFSCSIYGTIYYTGATIERDFENFDNFQGNERTEDHF